VGVIVRVLVVEEDLVIAESLIRGLRRNGHETRSVTTGTDALKICRHADLVLLDFQLTDLGGAEVCRGIRRAGDTRVIAVTGPCTELDRVLGFRAGLDDYLVRPYGIVELLARMDAVVRRVRPRPPPVQLISHGTLQINVGTHEVHVGDRLVDLTSKEFQLLGLLATHREIVISRRRIMSEIWQEDRATSSRTIDTHIGNLRHKLGIGAWIITVRGFGFRLGDG
jgi:DNA-binding response OmpR family regulator